MCSTVGYSFREHKEINVETEKYNKRDGNRKTDTESERESERQTEKYTSSQRNKDI